MARLPQGQSKEIEKALKVTLPYIAIGHRNFYPALSCKSIAAKLNFGGLGGALQGHAMGNKKVALNENRLIKLGLRFGSNMVAQSIEYAFQSHAKSNYSGFYTKDFQKKLLLGSYKSFFTS